MRCPLNHALASLTAAAKQPRLRTLARHAWAAMGWEYNGEILRLGLGLGLALALGYGVGLQWGDTTIRVSVSVRVRVRGGFTMGRCYRSCLLSQQGSGVGLLLWCPSLTTLVSSMGGTCIGHP